MLTDDKTSKTYTIKFADLDYAKITCLVNVYSGTTLSQSAYANEITLETKPTFEKAPLTTGTSKDVYKRQVFDGMLMELDDLIEKHSTEYKKYLSLIHILCG